MTVTSQTDPAFGQLRARWGWLVALGVVLIVAGIIALSSLVFATVASVLVVGAMMIVAGVFEIVHGVRMKSWGRFFLWILIGILYLVAGIAAFANPVLASAVLTLLLGAGLVAAGIVRIALGLSMRRNAPWGWVAASGVVTLLLGLVILVGWPLSSLYALGILLGVDLIVSGASWLSAGLALRSRA